MMAQIDAGERMARITDGSLSAGTMREYDAMRVTRGLEDLASGERRKAQKASAATLAGMGIAVVAPSEGSQQAISDG